MAKQIRTLATMKTPLEHYLFAMSGEDWVLKREVAEHPMEVYIHMERSSALQHAIQRVRETGGVLRVYDVENEFVERLEFPKMGRLKLTALAA